jgi:ABC-type lipoprotein release transport system permease subunit
LRNKKMRTKKGVLFGILGLTLVLAGCGVLGDSAEPSTPGTPSSSLDADKVIKVSVTGEGLAQNSVDQIAQLENVTDVGGYVAITAGQIQILGVDASKPLILEANGTLVAPSVVEGRLLESGDAGQNVMIAGKTFAENNETGYGYPILGMGAHNPPFYLDDEKELTILGVYETGSAEGDNWMIVPLDTAQQLFGKPGVNVIYVTVNDPNNRTSVIDRVKQIVGEKATVQSLSE